MEPSDILLTVASRTGCPMDQWTEADELNAIRGRRMKVARSTKGLTQQEMADLLGVTQQAYQKYEGGRDFRSSMLVRMCVILECSPNWLLGMDDAGERLEPEDPILVSLRRKCEALNAKGQRKMLDYADDLECNPRYTGRKSSMAKEE